MCGVVIQTAEPASIIEATEIIVKIIDITYANADLKQASDNATKLNDEERTQLLMILR